MAGILEDLRDEVCRANLALVEAGLVTGTFGNVSGVDREAGIMVIKPSGVPYQRLTAATMVPVSLETGDVVDGDYRPSSDTPTHVELYRAFSMGGIAHTHSESATAFAQALTPIPCLGTTHADFFAREVPVSRSLAREEVETEYERNTGLVIVETFRSLGIAPEDVPAVLVASHGPFTWGADSSTAVEHAHMLEYVARVALETRLIAPGIRPPEAFLIAKHHNRKHGPDAYYGQP